MDTKPNNIDHKLSQVLDNQAQPSDQLKQQLKETPIPYNGLSPLAYLPWKDMSWSPASAVLFFGLLVIITGFSVHAAVQQIRRSFPEELDYRAVQSITSVRELLGDEGFDTSRFDFEAELVSSHFSGQSYNNVLTWRIEVSDDVGIPLNVFWVDNVSYQVVNEDVATVEHHGQVTIDGHTWPYMRRRMRDRNHGFAPDYDPYLHVSSSQAAYLAVQAVLTTYPDASPNDWSVIQPNFAMLVGNQQPVWSVQLSYILPEDQIVTHVFSQEQIGTTVISIGTSVVRYSVLLDAGTGEPLEVRFTESVDPWIPNGGFDPVVPFPWAGLPWTMGLTDTTDWSQGHSHSLNERAVGTVTH